MTWYQATQHTFASLWCAGQVSVREAVRRHGEQLPLFAIQRYNAHLRPELFTARDFGHMMWTSPWGIG